MSERPVTVSEDQVLAFRARRHHLLGDGAPSPEAAARAVLGIQAQVVAPALWSLAMRCADPPTAAELGRAVTASVSLVRTWGQRDTVHIYDAATHWRAMARAIAEWPVGARGGRQPDADSIQAAEERVLGLDRPVTRSDLFDLVPDDFLAWMAERVGPGVPALRGAAGRFVWDMARRGVLCAGKVIDGEQAYDQRRLRFPDLSWPELPPSDAGRLLVRAYLAANGPATVQDVAHFFGAKVGQAREMVALVADELVPVQCGARSGLMLRATDVDDLMAPVPKPWPPRLLANFDTLLMCHKDKSWAVPDASQRPAIWAKAAQVRATVLDRGRLVAIWNHKALTRVVKIEITPLTGWRSGLERELETDAATFARHLEVDGFQLEVAS
jgi:hypothetical protein